MRTQIRIVAGELRGRKITCTVTKELRPTPQMVREAFFSILGNAIPGRAFIDIFSGTGVVGIEALSRGASQSTLIERDVELAANIDKHIRAFELMRSAKLFRTDAYRWVAAWRAPLEPVNIFISPPFVDLKNRPEEMLNMLKTLQEKVAEDSVIVVQTERDSPLDGAEMLSDWELRRYGRNELRIWQRMPAGITEAQG